MMGSPPVHGMTRAAAMMPTLLTAISSAPSWGLPPEGWWAGPAGTTALPLDQTVAPPWASDRSGPEATLPGLLGTAETFPPVLARRSRAPGPTSRRRATSAFIAKSTSTAWESMAILQLTTVIIASAAAGNVATPSGPAHHKHPINRFYQTFMTALFFGAGNKASS